MKIRKIAIAALSVVVAGSYSLLVVVGTAKATIMVKQK